MMRKYDVCKKSVITSFIFDCIKVVREYAPDIRVDYLVEGVTSEHEQKLIAIGGEEICPHSKEITRENVNRWHNMGFNVRAWGVDKNSMRNVYDSLADGMTVNSPDVLTSYIKEKSTN